jgi:hypothetical protein
VHQHAADLGRVTSVLSNQPGIAMARKKKDPPPLPPFAPPLFALDGLADWRARRIHDALPPAVVREIVHRLLTRGNFRHYSELYVAELVTVYSQWLMQVVFAARREYGADWRLRMLSAIEDQFALPFFSSRAAA